VPVHCSTAHRDWKNLRAAGGMVRTPNPKIIRA
jgi:hypothetical protein